MTRETKNQKKSSQPDDMERSHVEFDLGKLAAGGIFRGLGSLIELAGKLAEQGGEFKKERSFTARTPGGKELDGIFGVTIRTLDGGKSTFETFGNIKRTPRGPVVEEVREPIVDLFDENGHVRLIAELPGVEEEGLTLDLKGDVLTLNAVGRDRKYAKEILLPCPVKKETLKTNFHNGILEADFEKV